MCFFVLIYHLYIDFGEVSVRFFCPIFSWAVCFLEFKEFCFVFGFFCMF